MTRPRRPTPTADPLWDAVSAALDARRDPLADADLRARLAAQPATMAAVHRLQRRLAALPDGRAGTRWRSRVVAAAVLAVLLGGWLLVDTAPRRPDADAGTGTIHRARLVARQLTPPPPSLHRRVLQPSASVHWTVHSSVR